MPTEQINKSCPKCGYERKPSDNKYTPSGICPSCGIVYHKYDIYLKNKESKRKRNRLDINAINAASFYRPNKHINDTSNTAELHSNAMHRPTKTTAPRQGKPLIRLAYVLMPALMIIIIIAYTVAMQTSIYRKYRARETVDRYLQAIKDGDTQLANKYSEYGNIFYIIFDYRFLKLIGDEEDTSRLIDSIEFSNLDIDIYCVDCKELLHKGKVVGEERIFRYCKYHYGPPNPDFVGDLNALLVRLRDSIVSKSNDIDIWTASQNAMDTLCEDRSNTKRMLTKYYIDLGYKYYGDDGLKETYVLRKEEPFKRYKLSYELEHSTKGGLKVFNRYIFTVARNESGDYKITSFKNMND